MQVASFKLKQESLKAEDWNIVLDRRWSSLFDKSGLCRAGSDADPFNLQIKNITRAIESTNGSQLKAEKECLETVAPANERCPRFYQENLVKTILESFSSRTQEQDSFDSQWEEAVEVVEEDCFYMDIEDDFSVTYAGRNYSKPLSKQRTRQRKYFINKSYVKAELLGKYAHANIVRRKKKKRMEYVSLHVEKVKENIEKSLRKRGLKRFKDFNNQPLRTEDSVGNVLTASFSCTKDKTSTNAIIQIQYREITPSDYELLLSLDESIPKRTLSQKSLGLINAEKFGIVEVTQQCCICLEELLFNDVVKRLPRCGHYFHKICIDTWLTTSSDRCPIDSVQVLAYNRRGGHNDEIKAKNKSRPNEYA